MYYVNPVAGVSAKRFLDRVDYYIVHDYLSLRRAAMDKDTGIIEIKEELELKGTGFILEKGDLIQVVPAITSLTEKSASAFSKEYLHALAMVFQNLKIMADVADQLPEDAALKKRILSLYKSIDNLGNPQVVTQGTK